jgi:D-amino-acid oxidase
VVPGRILVGAALAGEDEDAVALGEVDERRDAFDARHGKDISTRHHQPPDWFDLLPDVWPCALDELQSGYTHGVRYTAPLVDMPVHLGYLARRLRAANGRIEIKSVATLHEAAVLAPIVLNCTGMGARTLVEDNTLRPIRGQHLVTTNPGITEFTEVDNGDSPDLITIYPHSDHLVLGGTAEPGSWARQPSLETAEAILARCAALDARLRAVDIIGHRVGLRPHAQRGPPRRTARPRRRAGDPQLWPRRSRRQPGLGLRE